MPEESERLFELYGDAIRKYVGEGVLKHPDLRDTPCSFMIGQFSDGRVRFECTFPPGKNWIPDGSGRTRLEGTTTDGVPLIASPLICTRAVPGQAYFFLNGSSSDDHGFRVGIPQWNKNVLVRFALVNFEFVGNEIDNWQQMETYHSKLGLLNLSLDGQTVTIRRVDDYEDRINLLRARGGVDVTCQLSLVTDNPLESKLLAERLCRLLTIARGTIVAWLYFDVLSSEGDVIYTEHIPSVTTSFSSGLQVIERGSHMDTKAFIETAYNHLDVITKSYSLNLIARRHADARSNIGSMEFRALGLVQLVEYLVGTFARESDREWIIDYDEFINSEDKLESGLREVIEDTFPNMNRNAKRKMLAHIKGLNRVPFEHNLSKMCSVLRIPLENNEVHEFKKTRDSLVHTAYFGDREEVENYRDCAWERYCQAVHLVDKILLGMFGYEGQYFNCSNLQYEMFKPME